MQRLSHNNIASLFFVRSCGLQYLGPSPDPIFPADLKTSSGYWIDSSDAVHVIGCQEFKEICDPIGACFEVTAHWDHFLPGFNRSASQAAVLNLLGLSFVYPSIVLGGKMPELLADRSRTHDISLALGNDHWQVETRRLFDIMLASMQVRMVNIARGKYSNRGNFQRWSPSLYNEACFAMKIQTTGWKNINLLELVMFSASLLILCVSTIKYKGDILLVWLYGALMGLQTQRFCEFTKDGLYILVTTTARTVRAILPLKPLSPFRRRNT